MDGDRGLEVLGIPLPSANPLFLALIGLHVLLGLTAVATGAAAMLSRKGRGRHSRFGTLYFASLSGLSLSMAALSAMRWREDYPLFLLGAAAFACAFTGRAAARGRWRQWPRLHLACMSASYVLMLTAFYVDNGRNLPLWRLLPQAAFWILPAAIGAPLIIHALLRHPRVLAEEAGAPRA